MAAVQGKSAKKPEQPAKKPGKPTGKPTEKPAKKPGNPAEKREEPTKNAEKPIRKAEKPAEQRQKLVQKNAGPAQKRNLRGEKTNVEHHRFVIDCSGPAGDRIFDAEAFKTFLSQRIKINGGRKPLGARNLKSAGIKISLAKSQIIVNARGVHLSKRALKYYTRKFLNAHELRDWLRVVHKDKFSYELRYFNISSHEDAEGAPQEATAAQ